MFVCELDRGRWCDVRLNVLCTAENKRGDTKNTCCEELECVFDQFPKYHIVVQM